MEQEIERSDNAQVAVKTKRAYKAGEFEGPLDLLWALIRESKINIYDIPIAQITEQYLDYLDFAVQTDLGDLSEFYSWAKSEWSVATLRSILTNEKYKGDALQQKTYVVDCITHKSKRNDDRPQYYVENNHPPIVSREVFDRVQTEMALRTSKRRVK